MSSLSSPSIARSVARAEPSCRDDAARRRLGPGPLRLLVHPLLAGLFGTSLVVLGGALAGAASPGEGGRWWSVPTVPVHPRVDLLTALALFYGGLIVVVRAWLLLRRVVHRNQFPAAAVVGVVVVWALPLLAGPPLGSRDVYAYAAQARLAEEGFDVYSQGPSALGDDPVLDAMDPLYLDAPVLYGPVFVAISSAVSARTGGEVFNLVLAFRALAVLGLAITSVGIWDLARTHGRDPTDVFVLAVANPLVLLHLVSGAHNEALMLAFLVSGVALGSRPWRAQRSATAARLVGIALCAFAGAIKMPGALGVAFLAWPWIEAAPGLARRAGRAVVAGAQSLAVIALAGRLTGWGWGWVDAATGAKPIDAYLSVTRVVGGGVQIATGFDEVMVLGVARAAGLMAAVVGTVWLLFGGRQSAVSALASSLLLFAVLHPTTQPWYLTWGLMLWAATSAGSSDRLFLIVTAGAAFVVMPVGPQLGLVLLEGNGVASMLLVAVVLGAVALMPGPFGRRLGLGPDEALEQGLARPDSGH